jgi:hypothetical protein
MADTISAATAWSPADLSLGFMAPVDVSAGLDPEAAHIAGSTHVAAAAPGLAVDFMTLTPDASGWTYDSARPTSYDQPSSIAGYAVIVPDDNGPVVLAASDRAEA